MGHGQMVDAGPGGLTAGPVSKLRNYVLPRDGVKFEPIYVSAGNQIIPKLGVVCGEHSSLPCSGRLLIPLMWKQRSVKFQLRRRFNADVLYRKKCCAG